MPIVNNDDFTLVGPNYHPSKSKQTKSARKFLSLQGYPYVSIVVLLVIVLGCFFSDLFINHDPSDYYLLNLNEAPSEEFYFGTDSLGRDLYSIIWYGGKASLVVGVFSAMIITVLGVLYGSISGMASECIDNLLMRTVEILQSIPALLMILLLIAIMGRQFQNVATLSVIIGITGWFPLARIVRSEVRQIRNCEYVLAARCLGASMPYLIYRHLIPNFISAIMFVVISSVSTSMIMESTLSFLGLGLPVETLSWGSILALADNALLLNTWWVIVIPGLFLVVTLLCITNIAQHFRQQISNGQSNL